MSYLRDRIVSAECLKKTVAILRRNGCRVVEAEDAVHEAVYKVYLKSDGKTLDCPMFITIAKNTLNDMFRKQKRIVLGIDEEPVAPRSDDDISSYAIEHTLRRLKYREEHITAFVMHVVDGFGQVEIAKLLNISQPAVSQLIRGIGNRLQKEYWESEEHIPRTTDRIKQRSTSNRVSPEFT
jgi:RNA polymerase sigma factor (sigma-70 family)